MTGSVHDGEALAALRRAGAMLAAAQLTWADVIHPRPVSGAGDVLGKEYVPARWRAYLREAWVWRAELSGRDRDFLENIEGRACITDKQHRWLADICEKAAGFAERRAQGRAA